MNLHEGQVILLHSKIDNLLELLYPKEFKGKGTICFKDGIFKGINANLYDISVIDFEQSFINRHFFYQNSYSETIESIKTNFNYKAERSRLYINHGAWHYKFDNDNDGVEQNAAYIVFTFEVALKIIEQRLTITL